jgi:hypothetical protein
VIRSAHRRLATWAAGLGAAIALTGLVPAVASAGAYDVQVCRNGYGNGGALTATGADPVYGAVFRVTNNCDGGYNGWNAISVSVNPGSGNVDSEPNVPINTSAAWPRTTATRRATTLA